MDAVPKEKHSFRFQTFHKTGYSIGTAVGDLSKMESDWRLLKPIAIIGRIIGFPIPNQFGNSMKPRILGKLMITYSAFLTSFSFWTAILVLVRWRMKMERIEGVGTLDIIWRVVYYTSVAALYGYPLFARKSLQTLFRSWTNLDCTAGYLSCLEKGRKDFICVSVSLALLFTSAIVETVFFDLDVLAYKIEHVEGATFLERYFDMTYYRLGYLQSAIRHHYHPGLLAAFYIISKLLTLGTVYGDVLCIALSYILTAKVQGLNAYLGEHVNIMNGRRLDDNSISSTFADKDSKTFEDKISWSLLHANVVKLRDLSNQTSSYISPILLTSLIFNIFSWVISLYQFISPPIDMFRRNLVSYIYLSLLHFILKTVMVIHFVSEVHRKSGETLSLIESMPLTQQNWKVDRIIGILQRKPIGIIFFDTMYITRELFVSTLSFVFTLEIMILQASSTNNTS